MDNNSKSTSSLTSSNKTSDQASRNSNINNNNVPGSNNAPTNTSTSSNNPSSTGGNNQQNNNNNNINYSLNRYNNLPTQSTSNTATTVNKYNDNSVSNNYEIIKPTSLSPNYNPSSNISSLPSVESVQAAISSIGANFNEEAIYAELTSQEDNRGYVRRPMNAFMVWSKQARRRIAMAYPNLLNCEISKLLGREWGRMSSAEKEPYVALSTKLRENHNLLHPDYTYKPRKRRRKGDSKSMNDFDSPTMDTQVFGISKGYSLQNPLYNTNLSTFYTTTSTGGQHRFINPSFSHTGQMTSGSSSMNPSYVPYSNTNILKNIGSTTNPSNPIGMPPLNYQNPSLINYPGSKLIGSQSSTQMQTLPSSHPSGGSSNVNNSGSSSMTTYIDPSMTTGGSSNQLNLGSSQFFPSGTSFFSSLGSSSTMNNDNNTGISNEELRNYLGNLDSTKIGNILNIYGTQDELNQSLGVANPSTSSGGASSATLSLNQAQNLANLGNFCASGGLFASTNNTSGGGASGSSTNTNSNPMQQQMSSTLLPPNPYYNLQQTSNILHQYQLENNSNSDNMPQGSNQNNSRQGNPHKEH